MLTTTNRKTILLVFTCATLAVPICLFGKESSGPDVSDEALLEEISRAAFFYFVRQADPESGLVRDKTGAEYCSTASLGFALAALPAGAERSWIDRWDAEAQVLRALRTLSGSSAHHDGVFCHYIDLRTGEPSNRGYEKAASTIDTALLMAGVITAGQYFHGECKRLADDLFARVNWRSFLNPENGQVDMAWEPEQFDLMDGEGHFKKPTWNWYTDETLLIRLLGIAAPNESFRLPPECMTKWNRPKGYYGSGEGFIYTWPGTLFTYMFAHCFYDFHRMGADAQGVDWFENTRRAAIANRDWCRDNAKRFKSYGLNRWGITACGGPGDKYVVPGHQPRGEKADEPAGGTLAPYGVAMALPFLKEDATAALREMRYLRIDGWPIWRGLDEEGYGLPDAFNIDENWISDRAFGIAEGPMVLMIENARTDLVWKLFMSNEHIQAGIHRAGFRRSPETVLKAASSKNNFPRVFCLNPAKLAQSKARLAQGDESLRAAMNKLQAEADEALKAGPFSVMDKKLTPASGDKHDYMSLGPYWWPDPNKPDGLPYIRRDGLVNPETRTTDTDRLAFGQMTDAAETLALAWYFTEHRPYAVHAARLLRVWFLDEATRMNPNLQFGQAVPGQNQGRDIGIIDTARLIHIVDAIGLLESCDEWTTEDRKAMRDWCATYLKWLRTSSHGLGEEKKLNNHGTWYDAQVVCLALFTGQDELAKATLEQAKTRRISSQIEPDGRQPLELARTKSLGYSTMNLDGFFRLAVMGEKLGVDLWRYESDDGRSIRKALDFLAQHVSPGKKWPYRQIVPYSAASLLPLLRRASIAYRNHTYETLIETFPPEEIAADRTALLWPRN